MVGAAAAVLFVPNFVNQPAVLSCVMAGWLGFCMFVAVHDRTPRSYVFLLAGYTTSIIGFPSVNAPGAMFDTAILRVQEIVIGILAAAFVHGFVFPTTVTRQIERRITEIRGSAANWTRRALAGDRSLEFQRERRRLILDINDLQQLSYHLSFDTGQLTRQREAIRALQHELSMIVGVVRAVEDRIDHLGALPGGLSPRWRVIIEQVEGWVGAIEDSAYGSKAEQLIREIRALEPSTSSVWTWREMLGINLSGRLVALVAAHRNAFYLSNVIVDGQAVEEGIVSPLLDSAGERAFHTDSGLAARSAMGAVMTVLLACSFWIATEWPDGAVAALIAGVTCALFGTLENPAPAARKFLFGSITGCSLAAVYGFAIFPRVTDFVVLSAALAPALLLLGSALARPASALFALGTLIGLLNTVGLNASYSADFSAFVNSAIAQNIGTAFAILMFVIFRTLGVDEAIRRLRNAGFRDVIGRVEGKHKEVKRWTSRMLDRISMLATRTSSQSSTEVDEVVEALRDMRIGVVAGDLRILAVAATASQQKAIDRFLKSLVAYYSTKLRNPAVEPGSSMLDLLDELAWTFNAGPGRQERLLAVSHAISLRCSLFPTAEPLGEDR